MKFCRVIVELVQMNRRRFVVRLDRHIPFSGERSMHIGFDPVQRFLRRRFIKSNRDTVLVSIESYLLYIRMRFDQPNYSRPRVGNSVRALRVWNDFVGHRRIIGEGKPRISAAIAIYFTFLGNSPGKLILRRTLGPEEYSSGSLPGEPGDTQGIVVVH